MIKVCRIYKSCVQKFILVFKESGPWNERNYVKIEVASQSITMSLNRIGPIVWALLFAGRRTEHRQTYGYNATNKQLRLFV